MTDSFLKLNNIQKKKIIKKKPVIIKKIKSGIILINFFNSIIF